MSKAARRSLVLAGITLAAASACGDERAAMPAASDAVSLDQREPASATAQHGSGLSHIPRPESAEALERSLTAHYPEQFVGLRPRTSVLVDVVLDERGTVRDVMVPDRSGHPETVRKILVNRVPGSDVEVQQEVHGTYDQAFGPAAAAALRDVRFLPALRDGRPVPFTLRMSVEFVSPARS